MVVRISRDQLLPAGRQGHQGTKASGLEILSSSFSLMSRVPDILHPDFLVP
jgi:hypothetical protein